MTHLLAITLSFAALLAACSTNAVHQPVAEPHGAVHAEAHGPVADAVIQNQNAMLAKNTVGKGFGPQSPRDINAFVGNNPRTFAAAPAYTEMNLCNIHFHKNAEHKGGEFTQYAGNGDGHGFGTGFKYAGQLSAAELAPSQEAICPSSHGSLVPGDTIEVHYVHSTAQVAPGPTLGACLSESISNPQLRVEAQVFVLVSDPRATDFRELVRHGQFNGLHQAWKLPNDSGTPVQYPGSTTGPSYNEKASPLQVTWRVRPKVLKVNARSVGEWCKGNAFKEDHAHGVRNLVTHPDLLAKPER
jgi:hypothetical protein